MPGGMADALLVMSERPGALDNFHGGTAMYESSLNQYVLPHENHQPQSIQNNSCA